MEYYSGRRVELDDKPDHWQFHDLAVWRRRENQIRVLRLDDRGTVIYSDLMYEADGYAQQEALDSRRLVNALSRRLGQEDRYEEVKHAIN